MLCCLAQACLTLLFPVLGLGWVAGPFLLALCPPSLSGPTQPLPICEPPRSLGPLQVRWEALGRAESPGP